MIPLKDNIPTDRFPFVTVALIFVNVVVDLLSIRHGGSLCGGPATPEVVKYGAIPFEITHPGDHCTIIQTAQGAGIGCAKGPVPDQIPTWATIFTAMFSHASIIHIGGNMLFLWIFGNNVEDAMGPVKYL